MDNNDFRTRSNQQFFVKMMVRLDKQTYSQQWGVDKKAPDLYDWIGAAICLVGVSVILWTPRNLLVNHSS